MRASGRFFRSKAGNVAMMFAIMAPLLILAGGGAVDIAQVSMRQAALQQAADAAAVGSVARTSPGYKYAVSNMSSNGAVPDSVTQSNVAGLLNANWSSPKDTTTPTFTGASCGGTTFVCRQNTALNAVTVSSVINATATYSTNFLGVIGMKTITLRATSQASDNIPAYIQFFLLLDNSPSMGLGATDTDIANMELATKNTPEGTCAFACHEDDRTIDNYYLANNYTVNKVSVPITMRITEVRNATQQLMQTAQSTAIANGIQNEFQVAIYDFGPKAYIASMGTPYLISPLTTDLTGASYKNAGAVDIMSVPSQNAAYDGGNNDQDTNLPAMLSGMYTNIVASGVAGNGASSLQSQKVLFIVTDGMNDLNANGPTSVGGSRIMGVVDDYNSATSSWTGAGGTVGKTVYPPGVCTKIKNAGIQIAILYTTYSPKALQDDPSGWSQPNVLNKLPSWYPSSPAGSALSPTGLLNPINPALKACASVGPNGPLFYEVSPSNGGIATAMKNLFQTVVASVRITG